MKNSQFLTESDGILRSEVPLNPVRNPMRDMAIQILNLPADEAAAEVKRLERENSGSPKGRKGIAMLKRTMRHLQNITAEPKISKK